MQSSDILCSSMQGHPEQAMYGKKNYCIFFTHTNLISSFTWLVSLLMWPFPVSLKAYFYSNGL